MAYPQSAPSRMTMTDDSKDWCIRHRRNGKVFRTPPDTRHGAIRQVRRWLLETPGNEVEAVEGPNGGEISPEQINPHLSKRPRRPKETSEQLAAGVKAEELWEVIGEKLGQFHRKWSMAPWGVVRPVELNRNPLIEEMVKEAYEIGALQDECFRLLSIYNGSEPAPEEEPAP
jgi:hypothetical protein